MRVSTILCALFGCAIIVLTALLAFLLGASSSNCARCPDVHSLPMHVNATVLQRIAAPPDRPYVPTRVRTDFHQVGFCYDTYRTIRLPLYGRPAPRNPNRWQYYVRPADDPEVRVGLRSHKRHSMDDVGVDELQTGDTIQVPELAEGDLTAHIYDVAT